MTSQPSSNEWEVLPLMSPGRMSNLAYKKYMFLIPPPPVTLSSGHQLQLHMLKNRGKILRPKSSWMPIHGYAVRVKTSTVSHYLFSLICFHISIYYLVLWHSLDLFLFPLNCFSLLSMSFFLLIILYIYQEKRVVDESLLSPTLPFSEMSTF